jgi:hypothetical protein
MRSGGRCRVRKAESGLAEVTTVVDTAEVLASICCLLLRAAHICHLCGQAGTAMKSTICLHARSSHKTLSRPMLPRSRSSLSPAPHIAAAITQRYPRVYPEGRNLPHHHHVLPKDYLLDPRSRFTAVLIPQRSARPQ